MITWDVFIYVTVPWIKYLIRKWIREEMNFNHFLMGSNT